MRKFFNLSIFLGFILITHVKAHISMSLDTVTHRSRMLLISDIPYATEQSFRLTDDVKYSTDAKGFYQSLNAEGFWDDLIKNDSQDSCTYFIDGLSRNNCTRTGNKSFWHSDYMIHRGKNYFMSVKMHGPFVKKIESINSENLKGSLLNDGVSLIQRTGLEYRNIEPLWNWTMLPGITADTTIHPSRKEVFKTDNQSHFVGQVSNGKQGCSAIYYNRLGVEAYKSYFFINDMFIALGAGLKAEYSNNLITTVNQRFLNAKPYVSKSSVNGRQWIWHDSIAYVFTDRNVNAKLSTEYKKDNWVSVDLASGSIPVADSLLTIYLNHHKKKSYSYIIKPGASLKEAKKNK